MRAEIRARLLAYADLASLVGARLSWGVAPAAEARPYVIATTVADDPRAISADGPGRLHYLLVQFDCVAESYHTAAQVGAELINALSTVVDHATTHWRFDNVYLTERGRDDHDPPQNAAELGLFRRIVEATFVVMNLEGLDDPSPPVFPPYYPVPD